jgi:hypothetical protein
MFDRNECHLGRAISHHPKPRVGSRDDRRSSNSHNILSSSSSSSNNSNNNSNNNKQQSVADAFLTLVNQCAALEESGTIIPWQAKSFARPCKLHRRYGPCIASYVKKVHFTIRMNPPAHFRAMAAFWTSSPEMMGSPALPKVFVKARTLSLPRPRRMTIESSCRVYSLVLNFRNTLGFVTSP